jgi:uncharacterized membrane protein YjjP (DUF1212 family)
MAHVIELAGESNPLTPQNVLNSLIHAASSTQQQVQTGTKQLQNWEKQEKYYTFLQVCTSTGLCSGSFTVFIFECTNLCRMCF